MHLGRVLDDKAPNYLKQGLGWSYHAPCAGHDGIQLALGLTFRPGSDYLFPYYRDLTTCLAAGMTAEEILLNGMSKATDVASRRPAHEQPLRQASPSASRTSRPASPTTRSMPRASAGRSGRTGERRLCAIGESSASEGYFYEAINGGSREQAAGGLRHPGQRLRHLGPQGDQTANLYVSDNFAGFPNLKIINCDGIDVFDSVRPCRGGGVREDGRGDRQSSTPTASGSTRTPTPTGRSSTATPRRSPPRARRPAAPLPLPALEGAFTEEEIRAIEEENQRAYESAADRARSAPDPTRGDPRLRPPRALGPEGDGLADVPRTPGPRPRAARTASRRSSTRSTRR